MLSEKRWQRDAIIRLFLGLLASISVGIFAVVLVQALADWTEAQERLAAMIVITLAFQGAALFWLWLFFREQNVRLTAAFGLEDPRAMRALLIGAVACVVVLPGAWALQMFSAHIMTLLEMEPARQAAIEKLQEGVPIPHMLYLAVMAIIVAPIVEETLFRGILYPAIKERGYPVLAMIGTALLFAAIHANLLSFLPLVFLAVILTVLYEYTDNLLAPIAAHSVFNAINFVLVMHSQELQRVFEKIERHLQ
jgi:membrane protease YdiL (CAAX protease family)